MKAKLDYETEHLIGWLAKNGGKIGTRDVVEALRSRIHTLKEEARKEERMMGMPKDAYSLDLPADV